jgi:hypothetical protein
MLNPTQGSLVHLRIEPSTIITLLPDSSSPYPDRSLFTRSALVVLPIAITTGLLYLLLLYLLKDAELLEAQRDRGPPSASSSELDGPTNATDDRIRFSTLARVMAADVEKLASSRTCKVVVGVTPHPRASWRSVQDTKRNPSWRS